MSAYKSLSKEIQEKIKNNVADKSILNDNAIRRNSEHDKANIWRPAYVRDIEKIMHCPYYNRYSDKTQVFSLYKNDDITRRALHVQLVSRIARNIGRLLNLNTDMIEAIALGHDIGHTPFGHAGEKYLDGLYHSQTGRHFMHNLQSVRVLDGIFNYNISLQTLDGIFCHNGESESRIYTCSDTDTFEKFDQIIEQSYLDTDFANSVMPSTLEGCVVRISDIIAYIGKDRQDAQKANMSSEEEFSKSAIGNFNAAMINNMIVDIVENSYGKDAIILDEECFENLKLIKKENYKNIYLNEKVAKIQQEVAEPIFTELYSKLLIDLKDNNQESPIFKHHINFINEKRKYYHAGDYAETESNRIVVDYIASMTDDYIIDLYDFMFPGKKEIRYFSYFDSFAKH